MTCDHLVRDGLLARELGLADDHVGTCADCQAELGRFNFLVDLPRLVALSPSPPGWERRVWHAVDALERPGWRRLLSDLFSRGRWLALPALVAAALLVLVLSRREDGPPPAPRIALTLEASHGGPESSTRSLTATVGDQVVARALGADAVWVYGEAGTLVARCPGDRACAVTPRGVELTFQLAVAARHRVLALAGAGDLTPSGDFDRDVLTARAHGAHLELQTVLAILPP